MSMAGCDMEPVLDVSELTVAQNGSAGSGSFTFNRANEI
jgi:hypothetical protein